MVIDNFGYLGYFYYGIYPLAIKLLEHRPFMGDFSQLETSIEFEAFLASHVGFPVFMSKFQGFCLRVFDTIRRRDR